MRTLSSREECVGAACQTKRRDSDSFGVASRVLDIADGQSAASSSLLVQTSASGPATCSLAEGLEVVRFDREGRDDAVEGDFGEFEAEGGQHSAAGDDANVVRVQG